MIDIVVFLVFSIVLIFFMAYPAIKIVEFLDKQFSLNDKIQNILVVTIAIALALILGAFLKYF
jgi:hypothetical protein